MQDDLSDQQKRSPYEKSENGNSVFEAQNEIGSPYKKLPEEIKRENEIREPSVTNPDSRYFDTPLGYENQGNGKFNNEDDPKKIPLV